VTLHLKPEACESCPYRRAAPSGLWNPDEYAKLVDYDKPTFEQPFEWFGCHTQPNFACHGWVIVHENRGHEYELVALRFLGLDRDPPEPDPETFFSSGSEAAMHGLRRIKNPPPEARRMMAKLYVQFRRLRAQYEADAEARRARRRDRRRSKRKGDT